MDSIFAVVISHVGTDGKPEASFPLVIFSRHFAFVAIIYHVSYTAPFPDFPCLVWRGLFQCLHFLQQRCPAKICGICEQT